MVILTDKIIKGKTRQDKLEEVRNLNLWGQGLDDCSILSKLPNLEVLSLSVNKLSSLKDFRHCAKLQELYLRKNEIRDLNEIQHLSGLKELRVLWLSDNPCAEHPNYKQFVARTLPHLAKLDNEDLTSFVGLVDGPTQPSYPPPQQPLAMAGPSTSGAGGPAGAAAPAAAAGPASPYAERVRSGGSVATSPEPGAGYGGGGAGHGYPSSAVSARMAGMAGGGRMGGGGGAGGERQTKNILYAVMALLEELEDVDLVYIRREIEQRLVGRY